MTQPAPPQLATQLLSLPCPASAQISTSYPEVDKALCGGLDYGFITTIAGGPTTGKSLLACQTLLSHLLSSPHNEAAVIDTSGHFEPLWLLQLVRRRLFDRRRSRDHDVDVEVGEQTLEDQAMAVLERVRVMRVFDFVGVVEAVGEVRAELETDVVMDSQDEDEDEGEEMEKEEGGNGGRKVGFLLVDDMMGVVGDLMRVGHVEGHALLTTFLRSLSHLTTRQQLCTILINGAVGLRSSTPLPGGGLEAEPGPRQNTVRDEDVSIFASTRGKPALGRTFAQCIDVRLWLSRVPRRKVDAGLIAEGHGGAEVVGVCEVLGDRRGVREGRWGIFELQ